MPGLSVSAVADALTLLHQDLWNMVDRQTEPFLRSILVEGKNGYRFHRFEPGSVKAFRSRFVSERGLADAMGILRTDLIRKIKEAGVLPVIAPPGGRRGDLPARGASAVAPTTRDLSPSIFLFYTKAAFGRPFFFPGSSGSISS
jgi:hypothetical protein